MKWPWQTLAERIAVSAVTAARPAIEAEVAMRIKAEVVHEIGRAMVTNANPLPNNPFYGTQPNGSPHPFYGYDRPLFWNVPASPKRRPGTPIDVDTLRRFADTYDVLRSCINHLKREVTTQKFIVVAKDITDKSEYTKRRIAEATEIFTKRGLLGDVHQTRRTYELTIFEDLLVVGAFASYKSFSVGGQLLQVIPFDAATVRPRYDAYGWPGPGEDWYEQWINGIRVTGFTPEELTYQGIWPMSWEPYYKSPVEYLVYTVTSALKSDEWNRMWLTDGNTPSDYLTAPENWTPDQIMEFAGYFDDMLAGNTRNRQKSKWVPHGTEKLMSGGRKDQDFAQFDLWLLRRTCAIMGVQPASIGFAGEQYKVSQETSIGATTQFGVGDLLAIRKEHYDDILETAGFGDLEIAEPDSVEETALDRAERAKTMASSGATLNEVRQTLGLDPRDDGDVVLLDKSISTFSGGAAGQSGEPEDPAEAIPAETEGSSEDDAGSEEEDVARWKHKALRRLKAGKGADCEFRSGFISDHRSQVIRQRLSAATTPDQVREAFNP